MLFFFVYCYADHRYLYVLTHSFPTRRSSVLRPIYDRVLYGPVDLPQPRNSVPSIDTNGSAFKAIALSEHMTSVVEPPRRPSPFKDLWSHDHATKSRLLLTVTIAVSAAIIALCGLALELVIQRLISV